MEAQFRMTPEYDDGYWDCLHGRGFDCDRNYDEGYCVGWQAGERALSLMEQPEFKSAINGWLVTAQAIEARSDKTEGLGLKGESAAPTGCAQKGDSNAQA